MKLETLQIGHIYIIKECLVSEDIRKHLVHLGIKPEQEIRLISKTKDNAILQIKASRIALDKALIESIVLSAKEEEEYILNLADVPIGSTVKVINICTTGLLRRRLMDMGITKHTQLFLKKVAPLGDPLEITLRGYELTLRKSEAQMIQVQMIDKGMKE